MIDQLASEHREHNITLRNQPGLFGHGHSQKTNLAASNRSTASARSSSTTASAAPITTA